MTTSATCLRAFHVIFVAVLLISTTVEGAFAGLAGVGLTANNPSSIDKNKSKSDPNKPEAPPSPSPNPSSTQPEGTPASETKTSPVTVDRSENIIKDLNSRATGGRLALVIGNSAYRDVTRLRTPINDAGLLADVLSALGFRVILGLDLDAANMDRLFRKYIEELAHYEVGLFYYAGHGLQISGENIIVPTDAKLETREEIPKQALYLNEMIRIMESSVSTRIIFVDACRNDPFSRSTLRRALGLAKIKVSAGTFIGYSTMPNELAVDDVDGSPNSPFASALAQNIQAPGVEIENIFRAVRRYVYDKTQGRQLPYSESSLLEPFYFIPPLNDNPPVASAAPKDLLRIEGELAQDLSSEQILVNGKKPDISPSNPLAFALQPLLKNGLNVIHTIQSAPQDLLVWLEEKQLTRFQDPYKSSYAIVVAVDKYSQPGYQPLQYMVDGARQLVKRLKVLGFPESNIITLFDEDATSGNIDNALRDFWEGGPHADADRLLFYFGGHGNALTLERDDDNLTRAKGMLITYNFKNAQPSRTGFILDNLIREHFDLLKPRHFIAFIDACASGTAIPQMLDRSEDGDRLSEFRKLTMLRNNTNKRARDMLVAGTNGQRALYDHGGIFTNALLEALDGKGDMNHDHIIEFDELSYVIKHDVAPRAALSGLEQTPKSFSYGNGHVVFIQPN